MCKGEFEMRETLERVNSIQENIAQVLLQMTHVGKGQKIYVNKEANGSHGETRPYQEQIFHYHAEGNIFGRDSKGLTHIRTTPRPYIPTFLDNQPQHNHHDEIDDNFEQYAREYDSLSEGFKIQVTLNQYCGIKFMGKTKQYH
jgi:hypothetical protein